MYSNYSISNDLDLAGFIAFYFMNLLFFGIIVLTIIQLA
jgi:hypothetical protein